jgi:uncharacterized membrane protein (UPF0127 family)
MDATPNGCQILKSELKYHLRIQWILVLVFAAMLLSCSEKNYPSVDKLPRNAELTLFSGRQLKIDLALSVSEQRRGVSGIKDKDFANDRGILFVYWGYAQRQFWMPDTYFDLDIFFLDKDLKILEVERNVPHYPGRQNPSKIPRTKKVLSAHVLEMKSDSTLAKELKPGHTLKWSAKLPLKTYEKVMRASIRY